MKNFIQFALATAFSISALASPPLPKPPVHNGIWWKEKSSIFKEAFLGGYKAGELHATGHATDVARFPVSELSDGVDTFYKDFRNRSIVVDDALNYIEDELRGMPDDKLATELQHLRQAAVPTGDE
jgi:hypothetical protein